MATNKTLPHLVVQFLTVLGRLSWDGTRRVRVRRGGRVRPQTQKKWGPEGWAKISCFFSLSRRKFRSFSLSLRGLLVEFWWCFEALGGLKCALLEFLRC